MSTQLRSDFSRMFLIGGTAGPLATVEYQGLWKAGVLTNDQGNVKITRMPDPNQYGAFKVVGKVPGEPGMPTLTLVARYSSDVSELLKMANAACDNDYQVHFGTCRDPKDFNAGWDKILVIEKARISTYKTSDLGALEPSERVQVTEDVTVEGESTYEIKRLAFQTVADTLIVREVMDVIFGGVASCGSCGVASDGCQIVLACTKASGGSPGYLPMVIWSKNGGTSWGNTVVNSMAANEDALAIEEIGNNVVSVSSSGLHYLDVPDFFADTGAWTKVTLGFVLSAGAPREMFSLSPTQTWIVGGAGYVYFTQDPTSGVTVQDPGVATQQQLNAIHGFDSQNLVAVGNWNSLIATQSGGNVWGSILGPAGGVNLNDVFMRGASEWWVAADSGHLYYTIDGGATWTDKSFPGSGSGHCRSVVFVSPSVGYMAHDTAGGVGRILRTVNGGQSWYVLPEGSGAIPANGHINRVAVCGDVNIVYGAGAASTGFDGVLVRGE